jgi:adenylate cyclase
MTDEPPLEIVVALHIGTVNYGNIGAADRLDFTVIGPAVNLVTRIAGGRRLVHEVRFAQDSPLEGSGFEPLVPSPHARQKR